MGTLLRRAVQVTVLGRLDRVGPAGISDLAVGERVRPQSMASTVAALLTARLVSRTPDATDKRRVLIQLTPAGREPLAADRRREGWLADAVERDLTLRERKVLAEATVLLARIAEGRDAQR